MSSTDKRVAEQSASTDPAAPPAKKQRRSTTSSKRSTSDCKSPEKPQTQTPKTKTKTKTKTNNNNESDDCVEEEDIDINMNKNGIIFLTGNAGKLKEVQSFFDHKIGSLISNEKLDLEEIQGTPKEIITSKLLEARKLIGKTASILVEDTSLVLNAYSPQNKHKSKDNNSNNSDNNSMNESDMLGFPGPFIKWLLKWDSDGNEGLCKMVKGLDDNSCFALCIFGFLPFNSDIPLFFGGKCDGTIADKQLIGREGFGWDPVFVPVMSDKEKKNIKSFSQMTMDEKNAISHRGKALVKLRDYLEKSVSGIGGNGEKNKEKESDGKTKTKV